MRKVISVAFLAILFAGLSIKFIKGEKLAENDRGFVVRVGEPAPDFVLQLTDGTQIAMSDLKGKVVMLQFTASWCGVCRKEMPFIEDEIWQQYKNRTDFALYGIDKGEPLEKVLPFIEAVGVSYPIALDSGSQIFTRFAFNEAGVTRNVVIDKTGRIAYLTRLFNKAEFDAMKSEIKNLLDN